MMSVSPGARGEKKIEITKVPLPLGSAGTRNARMCLAKTQLRPGFLSASAFFAYYNNVNKLVVTVAQPAFDPWAEVSRVNGQKAHSALPPHTDPGPKVSKAVSQGP